MLLDALLTLADAQAVTDTDAYTDYSVDLSDLTTSRRIGTGEPLSLVFVVEVAAAGSTDTTDLILVSATNAALSGSTRRLVTRRIANSLLSLGSIHALPIPPGEPQQRYIGGRVELGSGDTITISAYILPTNAIGQIQHYDDAVTWS